MSKEKKSYSELLKELAVIREAISRSASVETDGIALLDEDGRIIPRVLYEPSASGEVYFGECAFNPLSCVFINEDGDALHAYDIATTILERYEEDLVALENWLAWLLYIPDNCAEEQTEETSE